MIMLILGFWDKCANTTLLEIFIHYKLLHFVSTETQSSKSTVQRLLMTFE